MCSCSVFCSLLLFGIGCLVDSSTSIEIQVSGLATGSVVYVEYTPPENQDTIRIRLESENGRDRLQIEAEYDSAELRIESEVNGNTVMEESPRGFPFLFGQQTVLTVLPQPPDILIHAAVASDTFIFSYPYPSPMSVQRVLVQDLFSRRGPPFRFVGVGKVGVPMSVKLLLQEHLMTSLSLLRHQVLLGSAIPQTLTLYNNL